MRSVLAAPPMTTHAPALWRPHTPTVRCQPSPPTRLKPSPGGWVVFGTVAGRLSCVPVGGPSREGYPSHWCGDSGPIRSTALTRMCYQRSFGTRMDAHPLPPACHGVPTSARRCSRTTPRAAAVSQGVSQRPARAIGELPSHASPCRQSSNGYLRRGVHVDAW